MCMSPHEMTTTMIEEIIQEYNELLEDPFYVKHHDNYRWHLEQYEELLKERAEAGIY
jgi:hypothetical protein